ncbi:MAG: serine/threonine protein kinase [Pirellula sp.]|nr:serine/threonine protein kinase [Pirellula sp.]
MKRECHHITENQLRVLLFDHEDSLESTQIAMHVETCEDCLMRLTELAKMPTHELETSNLLTGYTSALNSSSRDVHQISSGIDNDASIDREMLEPPSHPEMLGRIGRYEIERRIGSGGMGVVFKAIDTELNRPVAVKVLMPHLARNGAARQRFSRESRAAAAVVHEHVVAIHNVDSNAKLPYLVMQYVSGESLQARVDREGPLDTDRILRIGIQAALGLAAAHEQGIVHRDIKPANIILEDGVDRLLITDFGLARTVDDASLTHTGVVAGTPSYMSPEQANGDAVDSRTDLFSLGSVLYFVATGHPPFRAERAMGVLHRICNQPHRPVWQINNAIPDELSRVIDRLLEKTPAKRFANATDIANALTQILKDKQMRRFCWVTRPSSLLTRTRVVAWFVAVVMLLGAGLFFLQARYGSVLEDYFFAAVNEHDGSPEQLSAPTDEVKSKASIDDLFGPAETVLSVSRPETAPITPFEWTLEEREFQSELNSIQATMNSLDRSARIAEPDSFDLFQAEIRAMEQALQKIDPAKNQN